MDGVDWTIDRGAKTIAAGSLPDGGHQSFTGGALEGVQVSRNDFLYLVVTPGLTMDCDTTGVELAISAESLACHITELTAGPPTQLRVAVHADRGLSSVVTTSATNTTVAIPNFAKGAADTLVTATKIDQTARSTFTLQVTDLTGSSTLCDPAIVTVGRDPGESPAQVIHHAAGIESHVTVTNGTPGVDRLHLVVNGHQFQLNDLHDGQTRALDVSSAMRKGAHNTIVVVGHGPKGSSAVVMIADS